MPTVYVSSVIDAPLVEAWSLVRDFNSLPQWHPAIQDSHIEQHQPADQVGCVRCLQLGNGTTIRERLLELSDREHRYIYSILESPFEVTDYIATLQLLEITDGNKTLGIWMAEFQAALEKMAGLQEMLAKDVFQAGLDALSDRL